MEEPEAGYKAAKILSLLSAEPSNEAAKLFRDLGIGVRGSHAQIFIK
jgi:hypothetical protein